jgi:hypothetical protein
MSNSYQKLKNHVKALEFGNSMLVEAIKKLESKVIELQNKVIEEQDKTLRAAGCAVAAEEYAKVLYIENQKLKEEKIQLLKNLASHERRASFRASDDDKPGILVNATTAREWMAKNDTNQIYIMNFSDTEDYYWLDGGVDAFDELELDEYEDEEVEAFKFYIWSPTEE